MITYLKGQTAFISTILFFISFMHYDKKIEHIFDIKNYFQSAQ